MECERCGNGEQDTLDVPGQAPGAGENPRREERVGDQEESRHDYTACEGKPGGAHSPCLKPEGRPDQDEEGEGQEENRCAQGHGYAGRPSLQSSAEGDARVPGPVGWPERGLDPYLC